MHSVVYSKPALLSYYSESRYKATLVNGFVTRLRPSMSLYRHVMGWSRDKIYNFMYIVLYPMYVCMYVCMHVSMYVCIL